MKIRPVGAQLFDAYGQTGRQANAQADKHDETDSRFSQFCEKCLKKKLKQLILCLWGRASS